MSIFGGLGEIFSDLFGIGGKNDPWPLLPGELGQFRGVRFHEGNADMTAWEGARSGAMGYNSPLVGPSLNQLLGEAKKPEMPDPASQEFILKWGQIALSTKPLDLEEQKNTLEDIYKECCFPTPMFKTFSSVFDLCDHPFMDEKMSISKIVDWLIGRPSTFGKHLLTFDHIRRSVAAVSDPVHAFLFERIQRVAARGGFGLAPQDLHEGNLFDAQWGNILAQQEFASQVNLRMQNSMMNQLMQGTGSLLPGRMVHVQGSSSMMPPRFNAPIRSYYDHEAAFIVSYLAGAAAAVDYCQEVHGFESPRWKLLIALAKNCFWTFPFRNSCFIADRPAVMKVNNRGQLHSPDGPALAWLDRYIMPDIDLFEMKEPGELVPPTTHEIRKGDGTRLYSINGVEVSERVIMRPESFSAKEIMNEPNQEVRRVLVERYKGGPEQWMKDAGAKAVQKDKVGKLWRLERRFENPFQMVEVLNSTSEPDGSVRTYFLRVPPAITSAKAGIAWTFGMTEEEYDLTAES